MAKCNSCSKIITKKTLTLECSRCQKMVHATTVCTALSVKQLAALKAAENLEWTCNDCSLNSSRRKSFVTLGDHEDEEDEESALIGPVKITKLLENLRKEVSSIVTQEMRSVSNSVQYCSEKVDEFSDSVEAITGKLKDMERKMGNMENENKYLHLRIESLEQRNTEMEQQLLGDHVEMSGIPESSDLDLPKLIETVVTKLNAPKEDVLAVKRLQARRTGPGPVLVRLRQESTRQQLIAAARDITVVGNDLMPNLSGAPGTEKIYIREALTPYHKNLLWQAKQDLKGVFKFIWFREGRVLVRKTENAKASLEVRQVGRRAVSTLSGRGMGDDVVIVHFNDVYNIEQTTNTEPVGGALRFSTAVKALQHLNPLVLFSGDAFSPSMLSTFTKGEQMVPVLNEIGTHCAVFGNHDFDFGLEVLSGLVAQCNFPWLMSNVIDNETGRPLGDGKITHALLCNGHRIGLIGLVEQEWLETLATINPEEVTFIDFIQAGTKLAAQLKQEGCEYVIALTHMRTPNDIKLAEGSTDIDLILGGHDHVYEVLEVNNKYIVKSGTDFRQFSKISISFGEDCTRVDIADCHVDSSYAEDQVLKAKVEKYSSMIEGKMDEVLGKFCVPLEGRFAKIRASESNLGNWVCDVILCATAADMVLLNSGTFRSDQVHSAGDFTLRDLSTIIPMRDPIVVVEASGTDILEILENSVSKYPSLEGRFPQVAGISFAFDPTKPPGQRVAEQVVKIGDEYLQRQLKYRVAVKQYLHAGNDGYNMLPKCKVLIEDDMCPEIGMAIQNHFAAINVRTGKSRPSKHRQSLVTLSRRHSLVKMLDGSELDGPPPLRRASSAAVEPTSHSGHHRLTRRASLDDLEQQSCELAPKVENRIIILDKPEKLNELLAERVRWESDTVIKEVDDESSP